MKVYSIGARQARKIAAHETVLLKQQCIENEHMLIGICSIEKLRILREKIAEPEENNYYSLEAEVRTLGEILRAGKLDPKVLRRQVRKELGQGSFDRAGKVVHRSEACKKMFLRAKELAVSAREVSCLHLLAAILGEQSKIITRVLSVAGVSPITLRNLAIKAAARLDKTSDTETDGPQVISKEKSRGTEWINAPEGGNDVPTKILFVSGTDRCNSPMAAEIFKKAIWEYDIFKRLNWRFDSAGTGAVSGERATLRARKAMKEIGLNIDNHRSRNIDAVNLKEYDLVLIMEERQRDAILHIQPQMVDRLWLLSQYAGFGGDIADPILSRNYAACVDKLEGCSDAIARRILERIPSSIESIDNMRIRWLIVPEIVNCGHGVEFWYTKKPGSMKPQTVLGFIDGHDWSRRHGEIHVFILSHDSKIWNSLNVDPVPMIKDLKKCISLVFKGAGQEQLTPSIWAQING